MLNSRPARRFSREELYGVADRYLAALGAGDPAPLNWAEVVHYTENNVELMVGDGLWATVSSVRNTYDLKCADLQRGEVSWFGVVEEHGHPAIMALRIAVDPDLAIREVESIICRDLEPGPFPRVDTYISPRPLMLEDVPEARRRPRERMISVADGYFDTLQLNDGQLFTEFTDDCDRIENGLQTTNTDIPGYPISHMGAADQFRLGQYVYDDRLRGRRFPLIDEEKGIVLAAGFIDHCGKVIDITWTDGSAHKSPFHFPHSYVLLELFKIVDGRIAGVEAVFVTVPYNMPSPWLAG